MYCFMLAPTLNFPNKVSHQCRRDGESTYLQYVTTATSDGIVIRVEYLHDSSFEFSKTHTLALNMRPAAPKPSLVVIAFRSTIANPHRDIFPT